MTIIDITAPKFRVWSKADEMFLEKNRLLIDLDGNLYEFDPLKGDLLGELDPDAHEVNLFTGEYLNDIKLFYKDIVYAQWEFGAGEYLLINSIEDFEHVMDNLTFMEDVFIAGNVYQNKALTD